MGGRENIDLVQACAGTRLRVLVKDSTLLDEGAIRAAGITGIARLSSNVLHLLAGLNTDRYAIEMREHLAAPPV
jgi:PTS system glucose-specific IIC component